MKCYKYLLAVLFAAPLFLCACGSDDDDPADEFAVVRSDLLFRSKASSGQIEVRSTQPFTVSVNKPWASATAQGNIVTVAVEKNTAYETRNAIVTLQSGDRQLRISLMQQGAVWMISGPDTYTTSDEDTTLVIQASLDFDYEVTMPEWMEGEEVEEGYRLHLLTNDTGGGREGTVTFTSQVGKKSIKFRQFGQRSIGGTYQATFNDGTKNLTRNITIDADPAKSYLYLKGLCDGYDVPVSMDGSGNLHIANGQLLSDATNGYIYIVLHQTGDYQNLIWAGSCEYMANITLTTQGGILVPSFNFSNSNITFTDPIGMEANATINGFMLKTASMPNILYTSSGQLLGTVVGLKLKKVVSEVTGPIKR